LLRWLHTHISYVCHVSYSMYDVLLAEGKKNHFFFFFYNFITFVVYITALYHIGDFTVSKTILLKPIIQKYNIQAPKSKIRIRAMEKWWFCIILIYKLVIYISSFNNYNSVLFKWNVYLINSYLKMLNNSSIAKTLNRNDRWKI
jgi:hypothetical protein